MVDEIYEKILVIIQSHFLAKSTFISKGPISNFRKSFEKSVFSIVDASIDIADGNYSTVNCEKLIAKVVPPVTERLKETHDRKTLEVKKFNHLCKMYVALLKEFYCLKDDDILLLLWEIGFELDLDALNRVAFCCRALGWSSTITVGFDRVHFAAGNTNEAAKFEFDGSLSDKLRRRRLIREFWEDRDPDRVAAVVQELS